MRKQYDTDEKLDMIEIVLDNFNRIIRDLSEWELNCGLTNELVAELEAGIKRIKQETIQFHEDYPNGLQ
jgi:hypothetical protein